MRHGTAHIPEMFFMAAGKVFMIGKSQAAEKYDFDADEVVLNKIGNILIMISKR